MQDFWFYIKLGLNHVLDFAAYDHILFLIALAIPFTFAHWKKVVLLATIFTLAHCLSLGLSAFGIVMVDTGLIEFLIPLTILLTALFNLIYTRAPEGQRTIFLHVVATGFFGLIHGFGFSNYFNMLMAGETDKLTPLTGFAVGIELAQVSIVLAVLGLAYLLQSVIRVKPSIFIVSSSILIVLATIPMLIATFPW